MDKRLGRGLALLVIGAGLVFFGKGITDPVAADDKLMGNAMLVSLIIGAFMVLLGLASFYDFATRAEHED